MSYRNERFNKRMLSLEQPTVDPAKDRNRSDGGLGAERMIEAIDYDDAKENTREREIQQSLTERLFAAEMRLVDAGRRHLIPVLLLIVENGTNREESLKKVPRATYFRHRDALLGFFSEPQPCASTSRK